MEYTKYDAVVLMLGHGQGLMMVQNEYQDEAGFKHIVLSQLFVEFDLHDAAQLRAVMGGHDHG